MYDGYDINMLNYPSANFVRERAAKVFAGMFIYLSFTEAFMLHANRS